MAKRARKSARKQRASKTPTKKKRLKTNDAPPAIAESDDVPHFSNFGMTGFAMYAAWEQFLNSRPVKSRKGFRRGAIWS